MKNTEIMTSRENKNIRLSLKANFSWSVLGNVVFVGCQWGMLVVLAKLGSSEMVGLYTLGLAVTAPPTQFATLGMRLAQVTDAKNDYQFSDYLGLRLITNTLALLVILGIVLFTGYTSTTALVIIAIGVSKFMMGISEVFHGLYQQYERMDRMAIALIAKGVLTLAALGVGLYLTDNLLWAIIWTIVVLVFIFFGYEVPNGGIILKTLSNPAEGAQKTVHKLHGLLPRWDKKTLLQLTWLLLPLGIVVMLSSLYTNIPRYFIERQLSIGELGIFAAIGSFERAGNFIVVAIAQSTSPRLSQHFADGKRKAFQSLLLKTIGLGVAIGIGGVLVALVAGNQLLTFFYQPEYARNDLLVLLMIAAGLSYVATFFIYGVTAARAFRVQVIIYIITIVVLILACVWLIPTNGLFGAAIAIIIGRAAQLISSIVITLNELRKFRSQKSSAESLT